MADKSQELFSIPLPGGRVARVPLAVLEQYVDAQARVCHGGESPPAAARAGEGSHPSTTVRAGEGMITINIYAGRGEVSVEQAEDGASNDVTAHNMSVDPTTGTSEWHTDWELGQCEYTDDAGFPQTAYAWHRHPFGTEYTEIFEG
jgi:L-aminopeptidase/D-esterase-like protein